MNSIYRRLGGFGLTLLMVPIFVGLLACMPVPIGNPERSRIDADMNGHWIMAIDDETYVAAFEPYDKRTWLVKLIYLEGDIDIEFPADNAPDYETVVNAIPVQSEDTDYEFYKVWRTKLGKYWYMTWETKGESSFDVDEWLVFRLDKVNADRFDLTMLIAMDELFEDVDKTRRDYERVIRRNQDNPLLFGIKPDSDGDDFPATYFMYRLADEDRQRFEKAL